VKPVNVSEILSAVEAILTNDPGTTTYNLTRGELVNKAPAQCPWIGLYRESVEYPIRILGNAGGSRYQNVSLIIVVQESHIQSGSACEQLLEDALQNVLSALFSDTTLRGTCDTIDAVGVRYQSYEIENGTYMQTAAIYFTAVTRVTL
jgi:hypothetical protein